MQKSARHRLLSRQLAQSTGSDGAVDYARLLDLVSAAYHESDADRRRTDRSITLMIDELHEANTRARAKQDLRFQAAVANMEHGLTMFDADRRLVICNEAYAKMYNLPPHLQKPGTLFWDMLEHNGQSGMVSLTDADKRRAWLEKVIKSGEPWRGPVHMVNGRVVLTNHQPLEDGGWVSVHEDITERHNTEKMIRHMAKHDGLTGLANRTSFLEAMENARDRIDAGDIMAVLCIDLDHFKPINDSLGHAAGDAVLKQFAELIGRQLGDRGIAARLGGDEFAILAGPLSAIDEALELAEKLIKALDAPVRIDNREVNLGASIGIAVAPADGQDAAVLMRRADHALYCVKSGDRGSYLAFSPDMDTKHQRRNAIEAGLRVALAAGELKLAFQPLMCVETRKVTCCEALMRWTSPEYGALSPAEFIPIAEETGLIRDIGKWALHTACAAAAGWPGATQVAVNVSPVQFRDGNLLGEVKSALAASGLPANRLQLEITESLFLSDNAHTLAVLYDLKKLGVRIALDDFGTGYSSLSYLRSFPFDKLKIDRSFVSNLGNDDETVSIVHTIIELTRNLGMSATAEGVETEAQFDILRAQGCAEVQGYLFSPPLPESVIGEMLATSAHAAGAEIPVVKQMRNAS